MSDFMREWIHVLCNKCNLNRFQVIKTEIELPSSHRYFTCTECISASNTRWFKSTAYREMINGNMDFDGSNLSEAYRKIMNKKDLFYEST